MKILIGNQSREQIVNEVIDILDLSALESNQLRTILDEPNASITADSERKQEYISDLCAEISRFESAVAEFFDHVTPGHDFLVALKPVVNTSIWSDIEDLKAAMRELELMNN